MSHKSLCQAGFFVLVPETVLEAESARPAAESLAELAVLPMVSMRPPPCFWASSVVPRVESLSFWVADLSPAAIAHVSRLLSGEKEVQTRLDRAGSLVGVSRDGLRGLLEGRLLAVGLDLLHALWSARTDGSTVNYDGDLPPQPER